jgi:hypothetical protein
MDNPCNGCTNEVKKGMRNGKAIGRSVGCHAYCTEYKKWKKLNDKRKRKKYLDDEYTGYISDLRHAEKKEWNR